MTRTICNIQNFNVYLSVLTRRRARWRAVCTSMMNAGEVERSKSVNLYVIASIAWSVWKTRNDWVFNNKLIKTPKSIYCLHGLGFYETVEELAQEEGSTDDGGRNPEALGGAQSVVIKGC